jgi:hypothetical protein
VKITRELFNRTTDAWEFLTDDSHVLTQGSKATGHFVSWTLYRIVETNDVLDENWRGYEIWQRDLKGDIEPDQVLARYERDQKSRYSCELFADLNAETKGELDLAHHHIQAGDLDGALQHLVQFVAWAIQEYADTNLAGKLWEQFGPRTSNGHLAITHNTDTGWQLDDILNQHYFGPLCPDCHRPFNRCICPPEETQRCEQCHYLIGECHCSVEVPF